jgi:hypothetical protein
MLVLLDGKGIEPALPHMAARIVPPVIPSDMRRQQPVHPSTQVPIVMRPEHKVEMIRHETIRQESHGHSLTGLPQQTDEGLIIPIRMKDVGPAIAAIDDVVAVVPD